MSFVARLRALDTYAVSVACDRLGLEGRVSTIGADYETMLDDLDS